MPGKWEEHPLTRTRSALHTSLANGRNTRSGTPAQQYTHARQLVRTTAHAHPLSTAHMPAKWYPFTRTRSALHTCQANGKNTRSRAPAQQCTHAWQMVRTPVHAHPLSTAHMPGKWYEHPLTRTRSALHTCLPNRKNTRPRAPAQHCTHARQMVRTPAHAHPLRLQTCQANGKNTRSRAPSQHCTHVCQMVRTPVHAHPLSSAHMPAKW